MRNYRSAPIIVGVATGLPSGVYFIQCGEFVKIGASTDVRSRLCSVRSATPFGVTGIGFMPAKTNDELNVLESTLHQEFSHLRYKGEWFRKEQALTDFITAYAQPWPS